LAEIINSETPVESATTVIAPAPTVPVEESKWFIWRSSGTALIRYLLDSEVHTFAFSVAANAILSFIPFVVLLYKLAHFISRSQWQVINDVIHDLVERFFPSNQDFVAKSLSAIASEHSVTIVSVMLILIACTGIFLPLEVALNQAWGVKKSRNYLSNQAVAFGLALLMVVLGMGCVFINVLARNTLSFMFFGHTNNFVFTSICDLLLAATTGVASILFFFSIYWLLPNRKVPWRPVFRTAVITGVIWLASKYLFTAFLPLLDLRELYGPFYVSVGLLFWAYTSGLIMFAGAQFSVTGLKDLEEQKSTGA
jgi:YihY family inner membrane protein